MIVVVAGIGLVEDRTLEPRELGGGCQASGGECLVERVILPVDVEIAEGDKVVIPAVLALGPVCQPFRDFGQFRMSVRESPPAPVSRSRTVMACMAVSSVVRMPGFFLCGEDVQIRAHRSSGLTGRQGLNPHGGRDCLSAYPRYQRQSQQDRHARPASGSGRAARHMPAPPHTRSETTRRLPGTI
jgi:hypothetical protein